MSSECIYSKGSVTIFAARAASKSNSILVDRLSKPQSKCHDPCHLSLTNPHWAKDLADGTLERDLNGSINFAHDSNQHLKGFKLIAEQGSLLQALRIQVYRRNLNAATERISASDANTSSSL
jgi:hypothetical protein